MELTWTKNGTEISGITYTAGVYTIVRMGYSSLPSYKWTVKVEGKRVYSADTLTKCKQACAILEQGLNPNLFYNWS